MNTFTKTLSTVVAACLIMLCATLFIDSDGINEVNYGANFDYVKEESYSSNTLFVVEYTGAFDMQQSELFAEKLNYIKSNSTANDIVMIRIESPGGAMFACDHSFNQVEALKRTGVKVVTVSDYMATSCGYMLMSSGDQVYASGGSMIGNVGVYMSFNSKQMPIIGSGRIKELLSGSMPIKHSEVKFLKNKVDKMRDVFVNNVLLNRSGSIKESYRDVVFNGDDFSGYSAKANGLVDQVADHRLLVELYKKRGYEIAKVVYTPPIL